MSSYIRIVLLKKIAIEGIEEVKTLTNIYIKYIFNIGEYTLSVHD